MGTLVERETKAPDAAHLPTRAPLTVVIPTLNEAAQIGELVATLDWADEVIVADGGSTDATVAIARGAGATVIEHAGEGGGETIAAQRNQGITLARNEWVFALDSDERISDALQLELRRVGAAPGHAAYRVRRRSFFLGRERRRGRWGRDWQVRLFTRERQFLPARVHERLEPVRDLGTLRGALWHTPYRSLRHQLDKMLAYAEWGAEDLHARGRRAALWELGARPLWRFFRDYCLYGSWLDGPFGLLTSVLTAYACFLKYAYLWELGRRTRPGS